MRIYDEFDQATLDREYSPSSCIDDIEVYLDQYASLSAAARSSAGSALDTNLHYGPGTEETLDLFQPDAGEPAPLHVFIHGGYWQLLSKDESSFAAPAFTRAGAAFAAINYTLAPARTLTGIVEENRRAIAWLYRQAEVRGIDRDRIFVSGHSAGAHLAMMLLQTDWSEYELPADVIKGVCAVSGVFDLEPVRRSYVNEKVRMDRHEAAAMSPLLEALRNPCPVVFAWGNNETAEFRRQSRDYAAALADEGVPVTAEEIAGRNHFDVILDLGDPNRWLGGAAFAQMGLT